MTRLVVFDIDGTLLDTRAKYHECMARTLARFGPRERIDKVIAETFGMPGTETMRRLGAREDELEELMTDICRYLRDSKDRAQEFSGVGGMLESLSKRFRLALATSRRVEELESDVDVRALRAKTDVCCATDRDMRPKPAPDVLLKAIRLCGAASDETVYVGDAETDMLCAGAAGVKFVLAGWNLDTAVLAGKLLPEQVCPRPQDLVKYL